MQDILTVSRENYLKAILEAESEGENVVPTLLSQWLHVSPPAVTKAIRRLRDEGFVDDAREGSLLLTERGREAAQRTAFRHYLVERMLSEIFGMEWHHIHAEAERLEHVISPEFEEILRARLGADANCPHGNGVLPESPETTRERGLLLLSDGEVGRAYTVARLYERDPRLLEFLHRLGIGPSVALSLVAHNYDQTLQLDLAGRQVTLGHPAASRIWVRPA